MTRKITHAVARIKLGVQSHIELGDLWPKRDWGYAGDYVEGMWRMLQHGVADDFVLASGETHSIEDFLTLAFAEIGIEDWRPYVVQNPAFMRPAEVDILLGVGMSSGVLAITGANGFVGTHVASRAADAGYQVVGIGRESEPAQALAPHLADYGQADLSLAWPITRDLNAVVHLAGLSAVGPSFADPQWYIEVNSCIMTRMCESLLGTTSRSRVIVVSSGSVYAPGSGEPIGESASTRPASPYAISKLLVETQASYYRGRGLDVLVAQPFNHIGPGQGEGFLVPDLLASITNAPIGTPILIGNPESARAVSGGGYDGHICFRPCEGWGNVRRSRPRVARRAWRLRKRLRGVVGSVS